MSKANVADFAGRMVGDGNPSFLIAEMSANHDRDLKQALNLVDLAADAGFDAIKLQTYTADSLTIPSDHPASRVDPVWGARNLFELYSRAAMPMEFHEPLFARARERGILAFTSVYDPMDIEFVERIGNPIFKISSFELTHLPLLSEVGKTGRPVILSTGMASMAEIEEALNALHAQRCGPVMLLHCCSAYPSPPSAVNLAAIQTMKAAFGLPVGFSDHTIGSHVALAAVMLGAAAIEKHFTNDPNRPGPDHRFSAPPDVMREMVRTIRECEAARGSGRKVMQPDEAVNKAVGRRSICICRPVRAGEVILPDAIRVVRPGGGLHPRYLPLVTGCKAARDLEAGAPLQWEDVVWR